MTQKKLTLRPKQIEILQVGSRAGGQPPGGQPPGEQPQSENWFAEGNKASTKETVGVWRLLIGIG